MSVYMQVECVSMSFRVCVVHLYKVKLHEHVLA